MKIETEMIKFFNTALVDNYNPKIIKILKFEKYFFNIPESLDHETGAVTAIIILS